MKPFGKDSKNVGRIIRGSVSSAGVVTSGAGFTAKKTSTGEYSIYFNGFFKAAPIVVAIALGSASPPFFMLVNTVTKDEADIHAYAATTGNMSDQAFSFIAMEAVA